MENNGWIKLETEVDLPIDNYARYHVITKTDVYCYEPKNINIEEYWGNDTNKKEWWLKNVSYYMKIETPKKLPYEK